MRGLDGREGFAMMHISACRVSGRAKKAAGKGRGWCRGVGIARGGDHAVLG